MILDQASGLLLSSAQVLTVTAPSTNIFDTAGVGSGIAPPDRFGTATLFGQDIGGGGPLASPPTLGVRVGTAFTAAGAATLQVQLQSAVDAGTPTYAPGTWDTIDETDTLAVALLTAGQWLAQFVVPLRYPGQGLPRFYRLNYIIATGPMLTGTINAFIATGLDDLTASQQYPAAY